MINKYFAGRTLVLATMHGKEKVLKPLLEQNLFVRVVVPKGLNTDEFGTFSGEVKRHGSPLDAAGRKCNAAHEYTGEPLVLASEGSFGAHPVLGFIASNEEWLLLRDYKNALEINAKVVSTQTNFSGQVFTNWDEVVKYATTVSFPTHGLMLRHGDAIHKGIRDWRELKSSFYYFSKNGGKVLVETDMRAHLNPTRMNVIREAGEKLLAKIMTPCPRCETPGFDVKDIVRGLLCRQCDSPTRTAKAHIYYCSQCGFEQTARSPDHKEYEDPMFCDLCNP